MSTSNLSFPMTAQQKSLWVLEQDSTNGVYNVPLLYDFTGSLDIEKMQKALNKTIQKNAALRINLTLKDSSPIQYFIEDYDFPLDKKDVSNMSEKAIKILIESDSKSPFNINKENTPLIRGILYTRSENQHYLLILMHHTISDGTSLPLFTEDFSNFYNSNLSYSDDDEIYTEYSKKQQDLLNSEDMNDQLNYWENNLSGSPELIELPLDRKRPKNQSHNGDRINFSIPKRIVTSVAALAHTHRVTPYTVYLSAFSILLSRYTRQDDIVLGTLVANRNDLNIENTIGYFANTILIHNTLSKSQTFQELLSYENNTVLDALSNSEYPIDRLAEKLQPTRDSSYNPLFQVLFVLQNTEHFNNNFQGLTTSISDVNTHTSKVDLNLTITPDKDTASAFIEYNSDLFEEQTIKTMADNYLTLLNNLLKDPNANIYTAKLLTPEEEQNQIDLAEQNQINIPIDKTMVDVFQEKVDKNPDKIAIKYNDNALTYQQLNEKSNQLANYLMKKGITFETKVGVLLDRSTDMIVSILGILKSGAAYVPIDSSYPQDRIDYILNDSKSPLVITNNNLSTKIKDDSIVKLITEDVQDTLSKENLNNLNLKIAPSNLAYIIYTSGSTGRPKGVLVEHHNVLRLIASTARDYDFRPDDIWTMFHSYAFDFSIWEIWGALLNGATLIVVPYVTTRSPEDFYNLIVDEHVTILSQTPSAFRQFRQIDEVKHSPLALRYITSGGEALDINNLKIWFKNHNASEIKINNMYGITETTVHATSRILKENDAYSDVGSVIGHPLADLAIYLLDENQQIVPRGVTGEMYVSGQGVTRGYLNRPELTDERFIKNPFHDSQYKVYKSGDLARINIDGELEYIGRADQQVKIRGFRIELGEIESVINNSEQIEDAVVTVDNHDNISTLISYIIPKNKKTFTFQNLKTEIKEKLPDYMIPSSFIELEELPLTANGKLDTKNLPKPNKDNVLTSSDHVLPETKIEEQLVEIWKEILNINNIGVTDDFFELGGHSLLAVKLTSIIKSKFNKNLPISVLFTSPTIRELAKHIDSESNELLENPLVKIKSQGSKRPLFIIHPGMGQVMCFNDLANNMDKDRPIIAIRAIGLYGECVPMSNVPEIAKTYIKEIKKEQPNGPYNLAGYCVGGIIANEMTAQLRANNETVNSLNLIDIEPPFGYDHLNEEFIVSFFVEQFFKSFDSVDDNIKNNVTVYSEEELKNKHFTYEDYINYMLTIVKKLNIVDDNYTFDDMKYWYETWKNTILAMDTYRSHKIDVPITVFHATEGEYSGHEWDTYSSISVKKINIDGDHYSILKLPYVKEFAKKLSDNLDYFDKN